MKFPWNFLLLSNAIQKSAYLLLLWGYTSDLYTSQLQKEKVWLFTYSYNRPDFIKIQHDTFKKFLKDEYDFFVFNDASSPEMHAKIQDTCNQLSIPCIDIPQEIHNQPYLHREPGEGYNNASVRNSNVVMYSLNNYGFQHNGIVAIFDSDMFLTNYFSIKNFLDEHDIAGISQEREHNGYTADYLWIGLCFMDMSRMPNKTTIDFNCGQINEVTVDTGGYTHLYLKNNPELKIRHIDSLCMGLDPECTFSLDTPCFHSSLDLERFGYHPRQIELIQLCPHHFPFHADQHFLHYYAGTNWNNAPDSYHQKKTKRLYEYIDQILNE